MAMGQKLQQGEGASARMVSKMTQHDCMLYLWVNAQLSRLSSWARRLALQRAVDALQQLLGGLSRLGSSASCCCCLWGAGIRALLTKLQLLADLPQQLMRGGLCLGWSNGF